MTTLLLVLLALVLSLTQALSRIDNVLYDTAQRNTHHQPPADVVLVAIDEASLARLGRWPWSRRSHAQLINRLQADGARVIGLDIVFAEPQAEDPEADALLAAAVARAGNVVLPVLFEKVRSNGQLIETLPLPQLTSQAAALGRVHAELDADVIARSIYLWEGLGQAVWPHFAQAMLNVANSRRGALAAAPDAREQAQTQADGPSVSLVKRDRRFINFSTSSQQLPCLSYAQVLQGDFLPGTFTGKLVLVGATATGMADSLSTPISGFLQPTPGVVFLANTLISMRSQTLIEQSPLWLSTLLACAVAVLPMLWLPYCSVRRGLVLTTAGLLLAVAVSMVLPLWFNYWVPLSAGLVGLLSAYPLWAWRKLEAAMAFFDDELVRLQGRLRGFHVASGRSPHSQGLVSDDLQRRIQLVRMASEQLEQLQHSQRETMLMVSHDIRVPLASAVVQVQQELGEDHLVYKQLIRARAWVEEFLLTSRAQMLHSESFIELDVVALLYEVADEFYPLIQEQGLSLDVDLPDENVWVRGHGELLARAVGNLLGNAIKFSPPRGRVGLRAQLQEGQMQEGQLQGQHISIVISDQGQGIAPEDQEKIFQRFHRLQSTQVDVRHSGVGMGLHFVRTTLHQHHGDIEVDSRPGWTQFKMTLPVSFAQGSAIQSLSE